MVVSTAPESRGGISMFIVFILAITILPLSGIILMEMGALGPDIAELGHPNGASVAYAIHLAVMYSVWFLTVRMLGYPLKTFVQRRPTRATVTYRRASYRKLALTTIVIELALILFVLFVVGAIHVLMGGIGKGEFRAQLGPWGSIAYLCRDFIVPMSAALVAFVYTRCQPRLVDTLLLVMNFLFVAVNGGIWGFRAAAVIMMIPALVILYPRIKLLPLIVMGVGVFALMVFFSVLYMQLSVSESILMVAIRASLGTGNTAWKLWDLRAAGNWFPDYWPTLTEAFGGKLSTLIGFHPGDVVDASGRSDYASLMTLTVKGFRDNIDTAMSNVTGTVFGEGVFAFGTRGYLIMSVLAGVVVAINQLAIRAARLLSAPLFGALAATMCIGTTFRWLNTGGIAVLFYLPFFVNYTLIAIIGAVLLRFSGVTPLRRGAMYFPSSD